MHNKWLILMVESTFVTLKHAIQNLAKPNSWRCFGLALCASSEPATDIKSSVFVYSRPTKEIQAQLGLLLFTLIDYMSDQSEHHLCDFCLLRLISTSYNFVGLLSIEGYIGIHISY